VCVAESSRAKSTIGWCAEDGGGLILPTDIRPNEHAARRVLIGCKQLLTKKSEVERRAVASRVEVDEGVWNPLEERAVAEGEAGGGGRTGRYMGADHWADAAPDLICLSKGLGAGYVPLGAMIARDDMVEAVLDAGGFVHGHTYAGNPLACAAGVAVLDEIEAGGMMENAGAMGDLLQARLRDLMQKYPLIGDVRGKGLLLAFEMMRDRQTKARLPPALNAHSRLVEIAYENGLIIYSRRTRGGLSGDHFLVCPPMIVTTDEVEQIASLLDRSLAQFMAQLPDDALQDA